MSRITRRYTGKLAATASAALALSRLSALPAHAQAGARILNCAGASFPAVLYSK